MKTIPRRRTISKILILLGLIFFSVILLNGLGVIPCLAAFPKAAIVTINGCMMAFQIFAFSLAMIISNGKVFKIVFPINFFMLASALLNFIHEGFINCGAGMACSFL
jgi:hypothetical protein